MMRDVAPDPHWQKAANRYCGPAYRVPLSHQRCVAKADWRPEVRAQPQRSVLGPCDPLLKPKGRESKITIGPY